MNPEQPPSHPCNGSLSGWCARVGLAKAFAANEARKDENIESWLEFQELSNDAAAYIGLDGCIAAVNHDLAPITPEPVIEADPFAL